MTNRSGGYRAGWAGAFLLSAAATVWFCAGSGSIAPGLLVLILVAGLSLAAATAFRPLGGLSLFVVLLFTTNHAPFFFNARHTAIYPHVAAILFGFLVAGWCLRRAVLRGDDAGGGDRAVPVFLGGLVRLAAAIIAVSAAVAFWRWTDFFPVFGKEVFAWMANSNGVPAVWARSSAVMTAAAYLLPFALLGLAAATMKNRRDVDTVLRAAVLGLGLAVGFSYVQHFAAPKLGNTDFWVALGQINGSFSDPNAFGGVLAILLPVLLGMAVGGYVKAGNLRAAGPWPAAAAVVAVGGFFAMFWVGARSAFLAFVAGIGVFAAGAFVLMRKTNGLSPAESGQAPAGKRTSKTVRRGIAAAAVLLLIAGGVFVVRSKLSHRLWACVNRVVKTGDVLQASPERYFLWRNAVAMTRDYPVSGVGVGAYIIELPDYYQRDKKPAPAGLEGYQRLDSAENFFLHVAAETGFIGLAAWLAVFLGLAWEIRRAVRAGILRGPDRWLALGALGSLIGFLANVQFHSFAQNFEVPFSFWLTAAVIVVLGRSRESGRRAPEDRSRRIFWGAAVVLIILFGASSLWNSSRGLSLVEKSTEMGIDQSFGLYAPERDETGAPFRWTRADSAWTVELRGKTLRLPVRISHPDAAGHPVRVKVSLGKFLLREEIPLGEAEWTEPGRKILEFAVPPGFAGKGMIRLKVSRVWTPSETSDSKDSRRLGAAVGAAEFY